VDRLWSRQNGKSAQLDQADQRSKQKRLSAKPSDRRAVKAFHLSLDRTQQGRSRMSRKNGYAVAAAVAMVLAGSVYVMSGNSTAYSYGDASMTSQNDVFAIMVAGKDLPSEQFDAI
jgi:hypothetical protein